MRPAKIKELCDEIGVDQADLARGLSIPAATWYRYMKPPDGSGIPFETKNLLIGFESVIRKRKASGFNDQEIKDAMKAVGVAGVVARAAMVGILPRAIVLLLASSPLTSWIGAVVPFAGAAISGTSALSGFALFQKLKPKEITEGKRNEQSIDQTRRDRKSRERSRNFMSLQNLLQIPQEENENYTFALAAGNVIAAEYIRKNTRGEERKEKIDRVLRIKIDALKALAKESFDESLEKVAPDGVAARTSHWEPKWKDLLLIDLIFASPFAPYEIEWDEKEKEIGLQSLALALGVPTSRFQSMCAARREAIKVHRKVDWLRMGIISAGTIVVCAAGGWLAAPMIGTALGTAAGLSGAAAVAHGLALLGGGALAAGGAGMAGGVWLVVGVSAAGGGVLAGSSTLFFQLGAQAMRVEILKFETVFKSVILTQQQATALAKDSIAQLQQQLESLQGKLTVERSLNEKKSARVQELEEKIGMIEKALEWMRKQSA